jgi:hypothetical protein
LQHAAARIRRARAATAAEKRRRREDRNRLEHWSAIAAEIDLRLTTDPDWPTLVAALERAKTTGYDIERNLAGLVTRYPLPDEDIAREVYYRLVEEWAESAAWTIEPPRSPEPGSRKC